ncbi:PREDICTED: uncharacterized protein LOC108779796 [Cyphomyrmex costatus]|uniref:uncharacterized protein LOC108779796 n=1 Tax=Cyphomyrmex costatus TaxID=456900 RepID=UPI0008523F36|nr:PREDICTED: uncharacterized protein LOC108779796 [Cyphomyrmex costatus]
MTRMLPEQFDQLCDRVRLYLTKRSNRTPISVEERLAVTLQFLAHSDSVRSKSWKYRIGRSTAHKIIGEICDAIWKALRKEYLPRPKKERWTEIMNEFYNKWNFPNCIGALDGSNSDGGVWANSELGKSLASQTADLPPPTTLPGTSNALPCAFVADEAFPLKHYLIRPYARRSLKTDSERIFNYRTTRCSLWRSKS